MSVTFSTQSREKQAYWALRGTTDLPVTGLASADPGTEVSLSDLNIVRAKEVILGVTAVANTTTYSGVFTTDSIKVPVSFSYTSDSSTTGAEIIAGIEDAFSADPNLTVINTGDTLVITTPPGYNFNLSRLVNLTETVITPLLTTSTITIDLIFENKGANTMYIIQDGKCLVFVPAGVMLQISGVDPYSGSLSVVGDSADSFELLALERFDNTKV